MTISAEARDREKDKLFLTDAEHAQLTPEGRIFMQAVQRIMVPEPKPEIEPAHPKTFAERWPFLNKVHKIPDPIVKVYFLTYGDGRVKIGMTAGTIKARIDSMSTGHWLDLICLASIEDTTGALEYELHQRFAAHRIRPDREWFVLCPEIQALIDEINGKT